MSFRAIKIQPTLEDASFHDAKNEPETPECSSESVNISRTPHPPNRGSLTLRAAKQSILLKRSYQWHQGKDRHVLASFCPSFLLEEISQMKSLVPHTFFGKGACLIADISGFVILCGRLSALGVNGIDDLRNCTNRFIGELVETVYRRGGDVVSFAGDAIICVFMAASTPSGALDESACCQNAIQCAAEIKNFSSVDLTCHVAVSYGEICFAILGGLKRTWTYLINGDCLTELADGLNHAASKEAVATRTCFTKAAFCPEDVVMESIPGSDSIKVHRILKNINEQDISDTRGKMFLVFADMNYFVPSPVCSAVAAGSFDMLSELRQVTTLFLKLDSYCRVKNKDLLTLQPFFEGVQRLVAQTEGFLRQFLVDDKGCVVIVLWGVPGTNHPDNCSRALHCGASIRKHCQDIGHQCSIGITTGDAYCGTVGSEIRQDYVAMGDAVNLAARLMCKAEGRLLMDEFTYSELLQSMSSILTVGEALMLKGRAEPMSPYVYSGAALPPLKAVDIQPDHDNLLRDRAVMELLKQEIASLASFDVQMKRMEKDDNDNQDLSAYHDTFFPPVRVMMLVGPSGSGIRNAVQLFKRLSNEHKFRHVSLRVSRSDGSIPYNTVRKLFLLLVGATNFITEERQRYVLSELFSECFDDFDVDTTFRRHFPMLKFVLNLEWNYEGVCCSKVSRAYEFIGDNTFQEILPYLFRKTSTTLVVEDANFCDELSWKELQGVLEAKAPLLILFTSSLSLGGSSGSRRLASKKSSFAHSMSMSLGTTGSSTNTDIFAMRTKSDLPQVSVRVPTTRITKFSVYKDLGALDDGTWGEKQGGNKIREAHQAAADELLKTVSRGFARILDYEHCTHLEMSLLEEVEVEEILMSTLEETQIPENLCQEVLELSGGSLYWCFSIAKYIKLIGLDKFNEELAYPDSMESSKFFDDSKKVLSKRLERHIVYHLESLSVKLQTIAKYASAIGDEFQVKVLFEILPTRVCISMHDLTQCMDALSKKGIVDLVEDGSNIYAFQNDLIRQTLMELVLPSDAEKMHQSVAMAYEKLFADDLRPYYSSLSYHYAMSPVSERGNAFKFTLNAADQKIGNGNFHAGYLYLEYAASFVKYDMEMEILSQVAETALFDLKEQKKTQKKNYAMGVDNEVVISDEDVVNFSEMHDKFCLAVSECALNGAKILRSGSFEEVPEEAVAVANHSDAANAKKSIKIQRSMSAKNAKILKMPSYSAKHAFHVKKSCLETCTLS